MSLNSAGRSVRLKIVSEDKLIKEFFYFQESNDAKLAFKEAFCKLPRQRGIR